MMRFQHSARTSLSWFALMQGCFLFVFCLLFALSCRAALSAESVSAADGGRLHPELSRTNASPVSISDKASVPLASVRYYNAQNNSFSPEIQKPIADWNRGNYSVALQDLRVGIESPESRHNPVAFSTQLTLGILLYFSDDYEQSKRQLLPLAEDFDKKAVLSRSSLDCYQVLACDYLELMQPKEAGACALKALAVANALGLNSERWECLALLNHIIALHYDPNLASTLISELNLKSVADPFCNLNLEYQERESRTTLMWKIIGAANDQLLANAAEFTRDLGSKLGKGVQSRSVEDELRICLEDSAEPYSDQYLGHCCRKGSLRWNPDRMPVKLHIACRDLPDELTPLLHQIVEHAIFDWAEASDGSFKYEFVQKQEDANLKIEFSKGKKGWVANDRSGYTENKIPAGLGEIFSSTIKIDASEFAPMRPQHLANRFVSCHWDSLQVDKFDIPRAPQFSARGLHYLNVVTRHELGHALGLSHSPNPQDIMFFTPSGSQEDLSKRDRKTIQILYGDQSKLAKYLCHSGSVSRGQIGEKLSYEQLLENASMSYCRNDFKSARKLYTEVKMMHPGFVNGYYGLAVVDFKEGKYSSAVSKFRRCLELVYPKEDARANAQILYPMAYGYFRMGKTSASLTCASKALSLDPSCTMAHWLKSMDYLDLKKYKESRSEMELYLKSYPSDSGAFKKLSEICLHLHDSKSAKKAMEKAVSLKSQS